MTNLATNWVHEPDLPGVPRWGHGPAAAPLLEPCRPAVNDSVVSSLVGQNLRRLRKQHRLSLEELARQSGVSRAMIGQIEQGKSIPSIKTLWQVAQALNVSVSWFLEAGHEARVLLIPSPSGGPADLSKGEGELRSLQQVSQSGRDAFYELRLGPDAVLSLPASTIARRVNVAVSAGLLTVDVDKVAHPVRAREVLQYESSEALVWRNAAGSDVLAYVVIASAANEASAGR